MDVITRHTRMLDGRSPALFLAGGALLTVYAALNGVDAFTTSAYPALEDVVGPGGFALGFLGLLGLSPSLTERSPTLTGVGAGCAALGAVGFGVITTGSALRLAGALSEPTPGFPVFLALATVGMLGGYSAVGIATLRSDSHSRTLGWLLGVPAAVFVLMITGGVVLGGPQIGAFLISGGQALALVSIGRALRNESASTGSAETARVSAA